ncbi:hypothetical protein LTR08_003808 [Meristemomyces frigidus]|nr:hypothetical protein LTR08_003808 [Meristemomyces frigidus]
MAGNKDTTSQTFDFETMAIVVYVMQKHKIPMGKDVFKMMSDADGKRGPDGFQHQFRHVKKRAGEIAEEIANGERGTPVVTSKGKGSGGSKAGTPATDAKNSAKRGRKSKKDAEVDGDDDEEESPTKKTKKKQGDGEGNGIIKEEADEDYGMFT